jgi:hypothetical protein
MIVLLATSGAIACNGPQSVQPTPAEAVVRTEAGLAGIGVRAANDPPDAVFRTNPQADERGEIVAMPPVQVAVNMCGSKDPDVEDTLVYDVDFGDGQRYRSKFCRTNHTYEEMGRYLLTACVSDGHLEDQASAKAEKCERWFVETRVTPPAEPRQNPPTASFQGVRTNLPLEALPGWRICFSETYGTDGTSVSSILAACPGERLIMACRPTGSPTLKVAALGAREDVTFATGDDAAATHSAGGVAWYYGNDSSWGFAPEGEPVSRTSCDTGAVWGPGGNSDKRLCWHTSGSALSGGWRCGESTGLNGSSAFERVVLIEE